MSNNSCKSRRGDYQRALCYREQMQKEHAAINFTMHDRLLIQKCQKVKHLFWFSNIPAPFQLLSYTSASSVLLQCYRKIHSIRISWTEKKSHKAWQKLVFYHISEIRLWRNTLSVTYLSISCVSSSFSSASTSAAFSAALESSGSCWLCSQNGVKMETD